MCFFPLLYIGICRSLLLELLSGERVTCCVIIVNDMFDVLPLFAGVIHHQKVSVKAKESKTQGLITI
jgi:hypothetical protein